MDEHTRETLTVQLLKTMQAMHADRQMPRPSEHMRGAPMILHYLYDHKSAASPSELSKVLGTSTARITAVLDGLEKKGMIERKLDASDRRKIQVSLTDHGIRHVQTIEQELYRTFESLVEYLGKEDAASAIHILEKLKSWKPELPCDGEPNM